MVVGLYDYLEWMYNSNEEYQEKYEGSFECFVNDYLHGTLGIEEGLTHEEFINDDESCDYIGTCDFIAEIDKDKRTIDILVVKDDNECPRLKGLE